MTNLKLRIIGGNVVQISTHALIMRDVCSRKSVQEKFYCSCGMLAQRIFSESAERNQPCRDDERGPGGNRTKNLTIER